jgi:hypothetical protein
MLYNSTKKSNMLLIFFILVFLSQTKNLPFKKFACPPGYFLTAAHDLISVEC